MNNRMRWVRWAMKLRMAYVAIISFLLAMLSLSADAQPRGRVEVNIGPRPYYHEGYYHHRPYHYGYRPYGYYRPYYGYWHRPHYYPRGHAYGYWHDRGYHHRGWR